MSFDKCNFELWLLYLSALLLCLPHTYAGVARPQPNDDVRKPKPVALRSSSVSEQEPLRILPGEFFDSSASHPQLSGGNGIAKTGTGPSDPIQFALNRDRTGSMSKTTMELLNYTNRHYTTTRLFELVDESLDAFRELQVVQGKVSEDFYPGHDFGCFSLASNDGMKLQLSPRPSSPWGNMTFGQLEAAIAMLKTWGEGWEADGLMPAETAIEIRQDGVLILLGWIIDLSQETSTHKRATNDDSSAPSSQSPHHHPYVSTNDDSSNGPPDPTYLTFNQHPEPNRTRTSTPVIKFYAYNPKKLFSIARLDELVVESLEAFGNLTKIRQKAPDDKVDFAWDLRPNNGLELALYPVYPGDPLPTYGQIAKAMTVVRDWGKLWHADGLMAPDASFEGSVNGVAFLGGMVRDLKQGLGGGAKSSVSGGVSPGTTPTS